jgi:hypothetical protein
MNNHHAHHTPVARSSQRPPTRPQLRLLRDLAFERGETFSDVKTFAEADAEIKRLKRRRPMRPADRRREDLALSRQMATSRGGAAAVDHDHETSGWGSSARWA